MDMTEEPYWVWQENSSMFEALPCREATRDWIDQIAQKGTSIQLSFGQSQEDAVTRVKLFHPQSKTFSSER